MARKQKLELTWIGKDKRERLEPRVLVEEPEMGHAAPGPDGSAGMKENLLIKGDNLLALKALEAEWRGTFQLAYADPPFNSQQAFPEYDDGLEHSEWLNMIEPRLKLIHSLLHESGTFCVEIDDTELAYLTSIADEVFGRKNRVSIVAVKRSAATGHKAINPGPVNVCDFLLIYAKNKNAWKSKKIKMQRKDYDFAYKTYLENPDEPYKDWCFSPLGPQVASSLGYDTTHKASKALTKSGFDAVLAEYALTNHRNIVRFAQPDRSGVGVDVRTAMDRSSNTNAVVLHQRDSHDDMYFFGGQRILFLSSKVSEKGGLEEPLTSFWDDMSWQGIAKEGGVDFPKNKKPERLLERIISMSTDKGEWVLDSFAGSGTTGAVAHKMERRWVMIELGAHCETLAKPRLDKVIDGTDQSGITRLLDWQGGGGYRYFRLAPSLLEKDRWGQYVISKEFKPEMLAEAVCKLMGFTYAPSQDRFWQHGHSTEADFIYVTTQRLTHEALRKLSDEVGPNRSLLICCRAHEENRFDNLTLRKIPQAVLSKAEWGRDDYSLNIQDAPAEPITEADMDGDDAEATE